MEFSFKKRKTDEREERPRVSFLNLHLYISEKGVIRKILAMCNEVDMKMIWAAHSKRREKELKNDKRFWDLCARRGYTHLLKWARKIGCSWDEHISCEAARGGHLKTLKWLRKQGCWLTIVTSQVAAEFGHLEILKWLRKHGCPWDKYTFSRPAANGHLEVLKWLKENGCPWTEFVLFEAASNAQHYCICFQAANNGRLEMLKWLRENGCSWDRNYILRYCKQEHILDWVKLNM